VFCVQTTVQRAGSDAREGDWGDRRTET